MATINEIKKLRELTGVGVMDAKRILQATSGNMEKAVTLVEKEGLARAESKNLREAKQGLIYSYIHAGGRVGVLAEVNCETDFVARTTEFKTLAFEIAMQIAAMKPQSVEELLQQEYIREPSKKVDELVKLLIAKTGENIQIARFTRFELGL